MSSSATASRVLYAANLRAALAGRCLSCAEAARRLGTNERVVRRWRNGEVEPRPEARDQLATLLDLDRDWFLKARSARDLAEVARGNFEPLGAAA